MRTLARSRRLQNRGSDPMNEAMRMLPPPLFFLRPGISQRVALLTASFLVWMHDSRAAETKAFTQPGIAEMRLVTDVDAIQAGKPFHIGLVIRHLPGYHTYWKNPGIVGVPTSFLWDLPPGFVAGEIQWPAPRTTQMAAYTAWGYEGDVCLVVEIRPPAKLPKTDAEGNLWLKARAIWMCCAVQCNPGWEDFQIPLVVARSDQKVARDAKNAGLIEPSALDLTKTKIKMLASEKRANDIYRQIHHISFTDKSGNVTEVITSNDASNDECSMSGVDVFIISRHLGG